MDFCFKYKFIKNILSKYIDLRELNFNVANENTLIDIHIDGNNCLLTVNAHEAGINFSCDELLEDYLDALAMKFNIAQVMEFVPEALVYDSDISVNLKTVEAFGFPAVLAGDEDYLIATPIVNEFDDSDIESLVISLIKYDDEHGFPDYQKLRIKADIDVCSSLPLEILCMLEV